MCKSKHHPVSRPTTPNRVPVTDTAGIAGNGEDEAPSSSAVAGGVDAEEIIGVLRFFPAAWESSGSPTPSFLRAYLRSLSPHGLQLFLRLTTSLMVLPPGWLQARGRAIVVQRADRIFGTRRAREKKRGGGGVRRGLPGCVGLGLLPFYRFLLLGLSDRFHSVVRAGHSCSMTLSLPEFASLQELERALNAVLAHMEDAPFVL